MALLLRAGSVLERATQPFYDEALVNMQRPTEPLEPPSQEWCMPYLTAPFLYGASDLERIGPPPPPPTDLLRARANHLLLQTRICLLLVISCCLWIVFLLMEHH